jgi:hypothetical protein
MTNFYICRNDTIAEIQNCLSRNYPNLTIKFFSDLEKNQSYTSCVMFSPEVTVRDINPDCCDGCLELNNNMTSDDLEKSIHDYFGIHVEISPATGNQTNSNVRNLMRSPYNSNPGRVRLPERSNSLHVRNGPFGY